MINNIVQYFIESGICISLLYIVFYLFIRKTGDLGIQRSFLIFSIVLSVIIPFLPGIFLYNTDEPIARLVLKPLVIEGITTESQTVGYSLIMFVTYLYITGAFLLSVRFIYSLLYIFYLIFTGDAVAMKNYKLITNVKVNQPFSFFGYVIIRDTSEGEMDVIVKHERAHMKRYHTLDLFLAELIIILHWYNPVVWMLRRSLLEIHEYQADNEVLSGGITREEYIISLINSTLGNRCALLTNNFNQSLIKKRIIMMTEKRKNKHKFLKVALAFMLTGIIVSYFSTDIVQSQVLATNQSQDKTVEKPPVFKGGQEAMMKYFAENINYPEEAKKKGVSGVVYISMVIDKKGKVVDPKIKKGIGAGCDEEALRAVTKMPDWIPGEKNGEKISTEMVLPVKFKLDDKKKK